MRVLQESKETNLESLIRRNEKRQLSEAKTNLIRSKSLGSLHSNSRSIDALKTLFESNDATQSRPKRNFRAPSIKPRNSKAQEIMPAMNGKTEKEEKTIVPADASGAKTDAKAVKASQKVNKIIGFNV